MKTKYWILILIVFVLLSVIITLEVNNSSSKKDYEEYEMLLEERSFRIRELQDRLNNLREGQILRDMEITDYEFEINSLKEENKKLKSKYREKVKGVEDASLTETLSIYQVLIEK